MCAAEQARAALQELQGLVQSSDVVFLLTDSREARCDDRSLLP